MNPIALAGWLSRETDSLVFRQPTACTYNPLVYARRGHEAYLRRYSRRGIEAILLGMNPGPWGMAQTGVPFGEVGMVRDFLGIVAQVDRPARVHPARPVEGFACRRREVSGRRLWGWVRDRFGSADAFCERFFVANYCPLVFLEASGRNRTPDKLPARERARLFEICDEALRRLVAWCRPRHVVGVGSFATQRARAALGDGGPPVVSILHPSPASPAANRGWAAQVERQLQAHGIDLPRAARRTPGAVRRRRID
ncbi:MAG: single-stranded DNA-binding protein [Planctomycetia bacterium]|nr:single-stranded DNA-binding protein [Planctomycetia bacterium]